MTDAKPTGELILPADPLEGFTHWLGDAKAAKHPEPTAMTLATVAADGTPHARIVLFKGFSSSGGRLGFEFFTNYDSRKSSELAANACTALVFHWNQMGRQIRVEGRAEQVSREESERYFQSRPRESQLGAWSSPQSRVLKNRGELMKLVDETAKRFGTGPIPCPSFWGGWRVMPARIEFWEERPFRLHERFEFIFEGGSWKKQRLAP